MGVQNDIMTPVSPHEWYEAGVSYRREERFGDAINAFARAASLASEETPELSKIRAASLASIELIHEITSFANTDLMNP